MWLKFVAKANGINELRYDFGTNLFPLHRGGYTDQQHMCRRN